LSIVLRFERADGFIACTFCGATYSEVLTLCPKCEHAEIMKPKPTVKGRYDCLRADPCDQGGDNGICCISCPKFGTCTTPCHASEQFKPEDEILCEFIQEVVV